MILSESFSPDWINSFRNQKQYTRINPPVFEKMIYALTLIEALVKENINFIFKGGTSLILLLDNFNRFSVDIDIITTESRENIESALSRVCTSKIFASFELDERRSYKTGVPKAHYSVFFNSHFNKKGYILLDVLFEESSYPEIIKIPVKCHWLQTNEPYSLINVPSVESIAGDKLTAFAPNTTGILYNKGKELEIIKQLYDLGLLFNQIKAFSILVKSFKTTVLKEISYRNLSIKPEDVLKDIIKTALLIAKREANKDEIDKNHFNEIQTGLMQIKGFLISGFFRIEDAIEASAKAAYIASKMLIEDHSAIPLPDQEQSQSLTIEKVEFNFLNRLKRQKNSAFFYWYKTLEILNYKI